MSSPYALPVEDHEEFWILVTALSDYECSVSEYWPAEPWGSKEDRMAKVSGMVQRLMAHESEYRA